MERASGGTAKLARPSLGRTYVPKLAHRIQAASAGSSSERGRRVMKTLPQSALVISLDLELAWGVRDHLPIARYRKNLLGVRQAIPAILRLFQQYEIHATWAAVGLLFAETREELFASLPAHRPQYDHPRLSPYPDLEHLRANEAEEPCYFGASLLRQIAATPHQEIGSHSFS